MSCVALWTKMSFDASQHQKATGTLARSVGSFSCQNTEMTIVHHTIRQLQLLVGNIWLQVFPVTSPHAL